MFGYFKAFMVVLLILVIFASLVALVAFALYSAFEGEGAVRTLGIILCTTLGIGLLTLLTIKVKIDFNL